MYGIGVVKFGEKQIGYIEKNSWDWGGVKPEKVEVEAEQVPGAPVLTLMGNLGGKLTLTEVSKIECQLTVNAPAGGGSPYEVVNTEPGE